MKGIARVVIAVALCAGVAPAWAVEPPPAADQAGQDPGAAAAAPAEPSGEQVRQAIQTYVKQITEDEGDFAIEDEVTGNLRTLTIESVNDKVGKTGGAYFACAQMKDADTGETLDVDFDVEPFDGELDIVDVRIHKVNGTERYTYDADSNIVPAPQAQPGA
jgi:hypothetical protein